MKIRNFNLLLLLHLIIFFVSGCKNGISLDTIKNASMTEETCLKACDEKEDKVMAEYEQCKKEAQDWVIAQNCTTLVCVNNAFERYLIMVAKCKEDYKKKLIEIRQCRKDCRDKFNLMMGIKP